MNLIKISVVLVLSFLLQSCVSTLHAEQVELGKKSFMEGEYKSAFRQLLPVAVEGNADAEYAVGYMYYYGYGTHQDAETGIFWMRKAADKHSLPAINALKLISNEKVPAVTSSRASVAHDF